MVTLLEANYPATAAGVAQALSDLDCRLPSLHWGDRLAYALRLVLEELIINIVTYGGQPIDTGWFSVMLTHDQGRTSLTIRDGGLPFDPTAAPQPPLDLPLAEREPGGLGLYFARVLASELHHVRELGVNQTTAVFIHSLLND